MKIYSLNSHRLFVDRCVAVSFPLQKRRICVRRNAVRANCVAFRAS